MSSASSTLGDIDVRTNFTGRGLFTCSPVQYNVGQHTLEEIDLGSGSISRLELVIQLNIITQGYNFWHFNKANCVLKYAPKTYIGSLSSVATQWVHDTTTPTQWPESLTKNTTLHDKS